MFCGQWSMVMVMVMVIVGSATFYLPVSGSAKISGFKDPDARGKT